MVSCTEFIPLYSELFKFLEKKNSIREEFNKLNASLNLSSDDIKSKQEGIYGI